MKTKNEIINKKVIVVLFLLIQILTCVCNIKSYYKRDAALKYEAIRMDYVQEKYVFCYRQFNENICVSPS